MPDRGTGEWRTTGRREGGEETLVVLQHRIDLRLDLGGQTVEIRRPRMVATGALNSHDGEASDDEHAAFVKTLGTHDRKRAVRAMHVAIRQPSQPIAVAIDATE
jgi:hypothetical protein